MDPDEEDCQRPPEPDDRSWCGNSVVPVVLQKPNLHFVLDVSGSMMAPMGTTLTTRLDSAKTAIRNVLLRLGHRIHYGLTAFPGKGNALFGVESCRIGNEIFATQEGDPVQCLNQRRAGPVFNSFVRQLGTLSAEGGTPLAGTLEAIFPTLTALEGTTAVVLMTDGAPNCGMDLCDTSECMLNVENAFLECTESFNCCDPELLEDPFATLNCVDRDPSVAAVRALADVGIKTYVVGIPGSEFYAELLDQLAEAGGTAREGSQKYYAVNDSTALSDAIGAIGEEVAISCDIELQSGKFDPMLTNVYFDANVVPADEVDGWTYADRHIHLHGEACEELLSGNVVQVQVVSGCPTIVR